MPTALARVPVALVAAAPAPKVPTHPMAATRMRVTLARPPVEQAPVRVPMAAVPRAPMDRAAAMQALGAPVQALADLQMAATRVLAAPVQVPMVATPRVPAALTKNQAAVPRAPMDRAAAMRALGAPAQVLVPTARVAVRARALVNLVAAMLVLARAGAWCECGRWRI